MADIQINEFNQGGVADSKWSGIKNSLYRIIGMNLHGTPGVIQANQRMAKISAITVDALCKEVVNCSDGNSYWFSSTTGKIFKVDSSGVVTLVYDLSNSTVANKGALGCLGAWEYKGRIYWATEKMLNYAQINTTADFTSPTIGFARFGEEQTIGTNTAATYTLTTAINEGATHKQTFTADFKKLESVFLSIAAKGTGNWTVAVHDASNTLIGTITVVNASLGPGGNFFVFSTPLTLTLGSIYHIHVYSTVADGTVNTGIASDLEDAWMRFHAPADNEYHPMVDQNGVLYIGDRHFIHQVDVRAADGAHEYQMKALDIEEPHRATVLAKFGTDLMIGTIIAANVDRCAVYRWNTTVVSFSNQDAVPEAGINAVIAGDNFVLLSAGKSGNLYSYDGDKAHFYKKIPGEYTKTKQAKINPQASAVFNGLTLLGVSNVVGNPCDQGVWSIGRYSGSYNIVLNVEYPTSNVDGSNNPIISGIEIGAIIVQGSDLLLSWAYNGTYGIDRIDYANKIQRPFIETRLIVPYRELQTNYKEIMANYADLPANTSMVIDYKKNHASSYATDLVEVTDTERMLISAGNNLSANTLQIKVTLVTSGNDTPILEQVGLDVT